MGLNDDIKKNTAAQNEFNDAAQAGQESFRDYTDILKSINSELGRSYSTTKDARSEYDSLVSISKKLSSQEEGLVRLADEQLNKLNAQAQVNVANLKIISEQLRGKEVLTDAELALAIAAEDKFAIEDEILSKIQKQVDTRQKSNQLMGVAGGLAATLDGLLGPMSKALGLDQMKSDMQDVADRVAETGESFGKLKVVATGLKGAMGGIASALTDPTVIFGGIMSGYNDVANAQKSFRQQTGQNISHVDSLNMSIATSADYIKSAVSLSKELGVNASVVFSPETITEVAELTELMGMGAHEAAQLAKFAKLSGKELSTVTSEMESSFKSFVQTNAVGINFQDVMNDVGSASAAVTLSLGSQPERIQEAAMEARKLGISLEQVDKIAGSLLNFESSINAELEAELLTGQSLNLEKARQLALNNDLAGVAKEIGKNEGILKAFSSGNRIQQEATAKAMGMSREEMSKMIYQQKLQEGLSAEQAANASDISLEEAKRLTAQDQIKKSMDKISQAVGGFLTYLDPILSNTTALSIVMGTIATVYAVKMAQGFAQSAKGVLGMAKGAKDMLGNLSKSGGIMGKFYKGGQFTPGGGRAPKGGTKIGGLFGKAMPSKESSGKSGGLLGKALPDKKTSDKLSESTKSTGSIKPGMGKKVKEFLKGLADGLANFGKKAGQILKGALVLGVVGLILGGSFALAMMMIKDVDPIQMIAFAGSLAILGLTMAVMGNVAGNIIMGALAFGILALALIPAAFAFSLLENVDIGKMIAFSLMLPLLALAAAGLGFIAPFIAMGAASLIVLGLGMIAISTAFSLLGDVDMEKINGFSSAVSTLAMSTAKLGFFAPLIVMGSAALLVLGAAMIPVSMAFSLLGNIDMEKISGFSNAITALAMSTAKLGIFAPLIIMGSAALLVLGAAMIPAAMAFKLLGEADMEAISNTFGELGDKSAALAAVGPALFSVAAGIIAFSASMAIATGLGFLGKLIGGGGPLADLDRLAKMSPQLVEAGNALNAVANGLRSVAAALSGIDAGKLKALQDFAESQKPSLVESIGSLITAPIQALGSMISGGSEENDQQAIIERLDKLIAVTEGGKVIEMDGNKVGKTLALDASGIG